MRRRLLFALAAIPALLTGCATGPDKDDYADAKKTSTDPRTPSAVSDPADTGDSYTIAGQTYNVMLSAEGHVERGIASWYGKKFHGQQTANGERYDMYAMTAAHRELPLPTYVAVTNLENGREVVVRVNDRGPFKRNRIIDLSYTAASRLGMAEAGTAPVEIRTVDRPEGGLESTTGADVDAVTTPASNDAAKVNAGNSRRSEASTGKVDYYIQVGAFAERDNAYRMVGRAEAAKVAPAVDVSEHRRRGKRLYRVRVGPVSSAESVDRVTAELADVGITDSHVVVESADEAETANAR